MKFKFDTLYKAEENLSKNFFSYDTVYLIIVTATCSSIQVHALFHLTQVK